MPDKPSPGQAAAPGQMFEADPTRVDLLRGKTVAVVGYGNQGHAHALNLRDSGVHVVVGNQDDDYLVRAQKDGFKPLPIAQAVSEADVVALLIPDDVQPDVFTAEIAPGLRPGNTVVVASGYCIYYEQILLPDGVNAVMVAPRMVGENVRKRYVTGTGSPSFMSVERDATGDALHIALAYAEAIGCTNAGCFASSAREEVALDLFGEQALWPAILNLIEVSYDVLAEAGFSDPAIIYELYLSGEPAEIFENASHLGLLGQLVMHSPASQLGQLAGALPADAAQAARTQFREILQESILNGAFTKQLNGDQSALTKRLSDLAAATAGRPMHTAEARVRELGIGRPA